MSKEVKKKRPYNFGKRKPIIDEDGNKWCDCTKPDLTNGDGRGIAYCLKCMNPYYH